HGDAELFIEKILEALEDEKAPSALHPNKDPVDLARGERALRLKGAALREGGDGRDRVLVGVDEDEEGAVVGERDELLGLAAALEADLGAREVIVERHGAVGLGPERGVRLEARAALGRRAEDDDAA